MKTAIGILHIVSGMVLAAAGILIVIHAAQERR